MSIEQHIPKESAKVNAADMKRQKRKARRDENVKTLLTRAFTKAAQDEKGIAAAIARDSRYQVTLDGSVPVEHWRDVLTNIFGTGCHANHMHGFKGYLARDITTVEVLENDAFQAFEQKLNDENYAVTEVDVAYPLCRGCWHPHVTVKIENAPKP